MSEISDELRIIAKDGRGLNTPDRLILFKAAELVEQLVDTQEKLIDSQARQIATNERLLGLLGVHRNQLLQPIGFKFVVSGWQANGWREVAFR